MTQTNDPMRALLIGVLVLAGLFLSFRGVKYAQCRSRCQTDCARQAEEMNPFRAFGGRNDLGRVLCEKTRDLCLSGCSFP
jgi:hypothetical protein